MAKIKLDHVGLTFRVRQMRRITLKEFVVRQMFRRAANPIIKVRALRDVCLRAGRTGSDDRQQKLSEESPARCGFY